jgi:arsenical pump membrane protein
VVLMLCFRRGIPARYDAAQLGAPADAIRDRATFRAGWVVLVLLLVGFFGLEGAGRAGQRGGGHGRRHPSRGGCARPCHQHAQGVAWHAPWQVVVFSLGMYLVVYGLRNAGLTGRIASLLDVFAQGGVWGAAIGTGFLAAALSSVMNNMPTVLVGALSIDASGASGLVKDAMVYANVIGCDLGPKITPIGSLATLLWLHVLEKKGTRIAWDYYFKTGIVLTLPVLFAALAALALRLTLSLP